MKTISSKTTRLHIQLQKFHEKDFWKPAFFSEYLWGFWKQDHMSNLNLFILISLARGFGLVFLSAKSVVKPLPITVRSQQWPSTKLKNNLLRQTRRANVAVKSVYYFFTLYMARVYITCSLEPVYLDSLIFL